MGEYEYFFELTTPRLSAAELILKTTTKVVATTQRYENGILLFSFYFLSIDNVRGQLF